MVEQPGATCPGSPGGATAGLGQVRHRLGSGVDLDAGGIGYGASAERLRDRSPPTVSTVGNSAQEFAAGSAATRCTSGGRGSPPNFTELTGGDLTAVRNPAKGEPLSPFESTSSCELQFAPQEDEEDAPWSESELMEDIICALQTDAELFDLAVGSITEEGCDIAVAKVAQ